jgi:hypothetical protein
MAALNMEYEWKADGRYARASFADAPIRRLFGRSLVLPLPAPERAEVASTGGDRGHWEVVWTVATSRLPGAVATDVAAAVDERGVWKRVPAQAGASGLSATNWTILLSESRFRGSLAATGSPGSVRLSLRVDREGA